MIREKLARMFYRLARRLDPRPPVVTVDCSGWMTSRPQVHVGFAGNLGLAGALTFDDNDVGNARAEMYAGTYSSILRIPIADRREEQKHG